MFALEGVRVLDLSRLLPGPFATMILADLGADVVKLEDPRGGDPLRRLGGAEGSRPGAFQALNRNKRSLALDLAAEGGAAVLRRLVRHFDVLVESFRPGVLARLGAGHDALRAENPRLVLCALTGYGQSGPYRDRAGHDLNYCAISGALALNGPEEAPLPFGLPVADLAGGAWVAVTGILAAINRRSITGQGGAVDVSMTEGVLGALTLQLGMAAERGTPLRRGREPLSGAVAGYRVYRTLDGRFVALAALEPRFFARFCGAVGRPDLAARQAERGGRGPIEELEVIFAGRTRDEWARLGREHDVCLTPVLEGDEPQDDAQLRARGAFARLPAGGGDLRVPASPVRLDGPAVPLRGAPELGADGEAVLAEAGFTQEEIATLRERGLLGLRAPAG